MPLLSPLMDNEPWKQPLVSMKKITINGRLRSKIFKPIIPNFYFNQPNNSSLQKVFVDQVELQQ